MNELICFNVYYSFSHWVDCCTLNRPVCLDLTQIWQYYTFHYRFAGVLLSITRHLWVYGSNRVVPIYIFHYVSNK